MAGDTCWATSNREAFVPGRADEARLNRGDRPGTHWVPAECDVSIRPAWFYHAHEDDQVKTPRDLVDLYYSSVGRGASLLLNLPPDRRGLIHERDVDALQGFRRAMDATMKQDVYYGVIPGTAKPTLLKPGAEKLGVQFKLDVQLDNRKTWGPGDHLTVESRATVYHAPTGVRLGYGEEFSRHRPCEMRDLIARITLPD